MVGDNFALTTSRESLRAIAEGQGPAQWAFALGYAGWGGGQLEGEMRRHGWFVAAALLALAIEGLFTLVQWWTVPYGLRQAK